MALGDYTPERSEIRHRETVLATVRGLNLDDLSLLVRAHAEDMQALLAMARKESGGVLSNLEIDGFLFKLIGELPVFAATVVAIAADEPEGGEAARRLPLPIQVKALLEIVRLTFEDTGGPKAFVALISDMVRKELPAGVPATT